MNPKLVEEVARAICQEILRHPTKAGPAPCYCKSLEGMSEICPEHIRYAQAAIRVCAPHFAEIAVDLAKMSGTPTGFTTGEIQAVEIAVKMTGKEISDAIKREGGLT